MRHHYLLCKNRLYPTVSYGHNFLSTVDTLGNVLLVNIMYMAQVFHKSKDLKNDDEAVLEGKVIQEHLESVNMDAWYHIYQVYEPQK